MKSNEVPLKLSKQVPLCTHLPFNIWLEGTKYVKSGEILVHIFHSTIFFPNGYQSFKTIFKIEDFPFNFVNQGAEKMIIILIKRFKLNVMLNSNEEFYKVSSRLCVYFH